MGPHLRPISPEKLERAFARMARRAAVAEYDRGMIRNAGQLIQRSRELLEATKHQVRPPSSSAPYSEQAAARSSPHGAGRQCRSLSEWLSV
jgi:hypothetical protein